MSELTTSRSVPAKANVVGRLSTLDRFLPLWIFVAMGLGLWLGYSSPGVTKALDSARIDTVSFPIAIGLLWMMYPVLARVKYEELGKVRGAGRMFAVSLIQNWIVGPILMFALAWLFLPDLPEYRTGLILVGLARCIAMVLIWNMLADGDNEYCAVLVALNSVFQVLIFSVLAYFFITVLPGWLGLGAGQAIHIEFWDIAKSVLIFLGIPLAAGMITRYVGLKTRGKEWYDGGRHAEAGAHGAAGAALHHRGDVLAQGRGHPRACRWTWCGSPSRCWPTSASCSSSPSSCPGRLGFSYAESATLSFTAASNNFELAIAVAVGVFGIASGQALAAVVGPLIEVPVLIGLVYVALAFRQRLFAR